MPNDMSVPRQDYVLGPMEQIPPGEGRAFEVIGLKVAVFRTRANLVYATQAECPHREGPLADGMLGGSTIVCPLHDRAYDLETGQEIGGACSLKTYPIRREADGTLVVTLPAPYAPA